MKKKRKKTVSLLEARDIELKAEEVISHFDYDILIRPQPTPLVDFVDNLHHNFDLVRDYTQSLGNTEQGDVILGKTQLKPLGLFVDVSLEKDARFDFVLGHEFGHIVLHRFADLKDMGYVGQDLVDTKNEFRSSKKGLGGKQHRVEWQANRFSSAILMPRATFREAVVAAQKHLGIKRNLGSVILDNSRHSMSEYEAVRNYLETLYQVNESSVEYRLKVLGILIDRRDFNSKFMSGLFTAI